MATLFRPWYVVTKKDGSKEKRQTETWYATWSREGRTFKVSLRTKNKAAAKRKLADIERNIDDGRIDGRDKEDTKSTPISNYVNEWKDVLGAKGGTEKNTKMKVTHVRRVVDKIRAMTISDLTADAVTVALAQLRKTKRFGIQTSNHHLTSCKQFCNWLVDKDVLIKNPLSKIRPGIVATDRRHERRDLSDDELAKLALAARVSEPFKGLSGPDREMLYLVTVYTGLRASEVASLEPESFDFDANPPIVTLDAGYSKRRRKDQQPLHPDLVRVLIPWIKDRPPGERLWPGRWAQDGDGAEILRHDLESAGIPYRDASGRVADFHALRHTFVTRLVKAGVSPKDAQTLARHSTITLTMDRYTHVEQQASAKALGMVPGIGG
jgi:integrase